MRVRHWVVIIIAFAVVGIGAWWWRHSSSSASTGNDTADKLHLKPKLGVASMNITDIDPERIKITSKVVLSNPLPIELQTNRLDYEIYIDSVQVIKSSYNKPISIKSSDSTTIEMPLEILAKPMKDVLKHFEKAKIDSADYVVKASFQVDVPIAGERTFNMDMKKRLPALRIPKMQPRKIDIDKLGLHKTELDMVMHIENPNLFPLKMKDGRYTVVVDKNMKMQGVMEKIVSIPAKGSQDVSMHLDIKTANLGKFAWKSLFEKKNTDFKVDFNCKLLTDNNMLKNSNMAFTAEGTLDELKNLAK